MPDMDGDPNAILVWWWSDGWILGTIDMIKWLQQSSAARQAHHASNCEGKWIGIERILSALTGVRPGKGWLIGLHKTTCPRRLQQQELFQVREMAGGGSVWGEPRIARLGQKFDSNAEHQFQQF
jgi:hypothetical protein